MSDPSAGAGAGAGAGGAPGGAAGAGGPPVDPLANVHQAFAYYVVAVGAVVAYDFLNTLHLEYRLYSRKGFKVPVTWMLVLIRYLTIAAVVTVMALSLQTYTQDQCKPHELAIPYLSALCACTASFILAYRTWCIISPTVQSKKVGGVILFFWIVELVLACVFIYFNVAPALPPGAKAPCVPVPTSPLNSGYFILVTVFDGLMTIATTLKLWQSAKLSGASISRLLLRDGLLYFIITFAINLLNAIFFYLPSSTGLNSINATLQIGITGIMMQKIIFNLQAHGDRGPGQSSNSYSNPQRANPSQFNRNRSNPSKQDSFSRMEAGSLPLHARQQSSLSSFNDRPIPGARAGYLGSAGNDYAGSNVNNGAVYENGIRVNHQQFQY